MVADPYYGRRDTRLSQQANQYMDESTTADAPACTPALAAVLDGVAMGSGESPRARTGGLGRASHVRGRGMRPAPAPRTEKTRARPFVRHRISP